MNATVSQFSLPLGDFENFVGHDVAEKDRPLEIISDANGNPTLQEAGAWNGHALTDETSRHRPAIDALVSALKKEVGYSNDFTPELRAEAETHGLTSHILEQVFENRDTRQTVWRNVPGAGDDVIASDDSPPDTFKELLDPNRADAPVLHLDADNTITAQTEVIAPQLFFGATISINLTGRSEAEKEANRKVATRFFEVATHFYGKEIMEYAFPLEHQKSILDKGLPLRMDQVRPALEKAQAVIVSVVNYLKDLPLTNLDVAESIAIAQTAQAEADRAAATYAELGEPARHLVDAIVPTLKAAGCTALLAGEAFLLVHGALAVHQWAAAHAPLAERFFEAHIRPEPVFNDIERFFEAPNLFERCLLDVLSLELVTIVTAIPTLLVGFPTALIMRLQVLKITSSLQEIDKAFQRFAKAQAAKEKALEAQLTANTAINRALVVTKKEDSEKMMDRIEEAVHSLPPEERYPKNMEYMRAMEEASYLETHAERAVALATEADKRPINSKPPKNIFPTPPWKRGAGI